MNRPALGISAILGILLGTAVAARADNVRCLGELDGRNVHGNLVVPDDAVCTLRDMVVTGNVLVGHGAALRLFDGVAIRGNLLIDHCDYASFEPLTPAAQIPVEGNVEIENCREASGKLFSGGRVTIGGNFACHDNAAPCYAASLTIGGDARIDHNSGGPSFIEGNTIAGNLQCVGNGGVTDYGSPNTVAGQKLGECAGLSTGLSN